MDFLCTNHYLPFIPFSDFLFTHVRISSAPTTICHSFNSWISSLLIYGYFLRQPLMVIHSILGCLVDYSSAFHCTNRYLPFILWISSFLIFILQLHQPLFADYHSLRYESSTLIFYKLNRCLAR